MEYFSSTKTAYVGYVWCLIGEVVGVFNYTDYVPFSPIRPTINAAVFQHSGQVDAEAALQSASENFQHQYAIPEAEERTAVAVPPGRHGRR